MYHLVATVCCGCVKVVAVGASLFVVVGVSLVVVMGVSWACHLQHVLIHCSINCGSSDHCC